ncbi:SDR family oxidoreductase [Brachybacterium alimentarium]|uniref:SDR family oxidoreductase n=1 Tax=Brachybacterium alimentarium TaxID=47845 RepID=UPI000DF1E933|nr:SDR family oxidoreductase [Brachybacterium alimentarium]RCS63904.1 SDR family NAD(P)-dependent oxidoreductase [Brachybacterium alimentarium]RCS85995.1 SDR family NAD(P)-dependent oxidoreductase [Brachybacterium alimentarium]
MASNDQLTFTDPVTRFPDITPPKQDQPEPGLDAELIPGTDRGEDSYRGTGRLDGRRALITGADSGIGAAVAIAFAREGADVALNYLPQEEKDAQHIAKIIRRTGRRAILLPGDLTDASFCRSLVEEAVRELGGLDALVNNAGRQIAVESLEELEDEQWTTTYEVNIHAMYRITKAALAHLPAGSTIVNTTSIQAYEPSTTLIDYASTKAAINNFSKGLAQQLAPKGIRVNAVAPGPIWTPLQVSDGQPKEVLPEFGKSTPLGRAGQPTELALAYVFLTSPESSYVLGETLHVNGGNPTP